MDLTNSDGAAVEAQAASAGVGVEITADEGQGSYTGANIRVLEGLEAVRSGSVEFVPERWTKVYCDWLENSQDWCISRQLWWGHSIPVWYCDECKQQICTREDPTECPNCGNGNLRADEDVLDTWFSSALWPFSTLGWPWT